jgi:hypothetical protein
MIPLFAHAGKFFLQGCSLRLRSIDIRLELFHPIVILIVVVHLSQSLLILHFVLNGLSLNLELCNLLVDMTELFDNILGGISAVLEHLLSF